MKDEEIIIGSFFGFYFNKEEAKKKLKGGGRGSELVFTTERIIILEFKMNILMKNARQDPLFQYSEASSGSYFEKKEALEKLLEDPSSIVVNINEIDSFKLEPRTDFKVLKSSDIWVLNIYTDGDRVNPKHQVILRVKPDCLEVLKETVNKAFPKPSL